jgi:hypothetical protein
MIRLVIVLTLIVLAPTLAGAQPPHAYSAPPPATFLDQPLYVPDPAATGKLARVGSGATLRDFVGSLGDGYWAPGATGASWVFHAGHRNVLTGQGTESDLVFRAANPKDLPAGTGVALIQATQNGQAIQPAQIASTFGQAPAAPAIKTTEVPNTDLAQLAFGRTGHDIFGDQTLSDRLKLLMGQSFYLVKPWADAAYVPATAQGPYVIADICAPPACGGDSARVVFDHTGHAWAALTRVQGTTIYGDPPQFVKRILTQ